MPDSKVSQLASGAPGLAADEIHIARAGGLSRKLRLDEAAAVGARRNLVINAGCQVAQRGNLIVNANGRNYGGCDRIGVVSGGFATVQYIMLQAGFAGSNSGFSQQIGNLITTGAGSLTYDTRLESIDTKALNGKSVTFSATILQQTGVAQNVQLVLRKANAADNFAAQTLLVASGITAVPTGVMTRLSAPYTFGATDGDNGVSLEVYFSAVGAFASVQIYVGDFELVPGPASVIPIARSAAEEFNLCRRYYRHFANGADHAPFAAGAFYTSTLFMVGCSFDPPMRAGPTLLVSGGADFLVESNAGSFASSAAGITRATPVSARLDFTTAAATAGHAGVVSAIPNKWLALSAEL